MTRSARDAIFNDIRRSLRRGPLGAMAQATVAARLSEPHPNLVPARGRGEPAELVERFTAVVVETQATLSRVATVDQAPVAVAAHLTQMGLPARVIAAPDLRSLGWEAAGLAAEFGAARPGDLVSVTPCFRAVAETGTLVTLSGPGRPSSLNFLPDVHIVLVEASRVVGAYEDAWAAFRVEGGAPRTINWITGPSRTADIEQTLLLGAHGPRSLHVVLIDGA